MSIIYRLNEDGILVSSLELDSVANETSSSGSFIYNTRPRKASRPTKAKPQVHCPVCNVSVNETNLARHMEKVHQQVEVGTNPQLPQPKPSAPIAKAASASSQTSNRSASMRRCAVCFSPVKADEMEKHMQKMHPAKRPPALAQPAAQRLRPKSQQTGQQPIWAAKCPVCGIAVRRESLVQHARETHSPADVSKVPASTPGASTPGPSKSGKQAGAKPKVLIAECNVCHASIRADQLEAHVRQAHASERPSTGSSTAIVGSKPQAHQGAGSGKSLVECGVCHVAVRADRLDKHMWKVHRTGKSSVAPPTATGRSKPPPSRSERRDERVSQPPERPVYPEQSLRQSDHESMDGSKYMGFMSREWDGKFGSFPLHDSFDDEADAE